MVLLYVFILLISFSILFFFPSFYLFRYSNHYYVTGPRIVVVKVFSFSKMLKNIFVVFPLLNLILFVFLCLKNWQSVSPVLILWYVSKDRKESEERRKKF